jgi:hypothetical protein
MPEIQVFAFCFQRVWRAIFKMHLGTVLQTALKKAPGIKNPEPTEII